MCIRVLIVMFFFCYLGSFRPIINPHTHISAGSVSRVPLILKQSVIPVLSLGLPIRVVVTPHGFIMPFLYCSSNCL